VLVVVMMRSMTVVGVCMAKEIDVSMGGRLLFDIGLRCRIRIVGSILHTFFKRPEILVNQVAVPVEKDPVLKHPNGHWDPVEVVCEERKVNQGNYLQNCRVHIANHPPDSWTAFPLNPKCQAATEEIVYDASKR